MDHRGRQTVYPAIVFLLGAGTLGVHVFHLVSEENLYQILTGVVPPAIVSLGLMAAAVLLSRSSLPDRRLPRVLGWVLGGTAALAALGGALLLYQITHGAEISDAVFMIANWAATGGLGGVFVGYYDAKLHETQSALAAERDALEDRQASLERQNQRLERLAHVVSHDIRNPINVATGRIQLARETGEMSELEPALDALDRMNAIVEDTLDMARCGQAVEEDEIEAVTLREIAESSWAAVQTPDATLQVTGDLQFVADRSRVRNVFENLYRNAVEHGGSEVTVTVTVGPLENGSGFYVEDDGPGITTADDVFEPGVSTSPEGTGLGLAIVHDIVTAHGWEVEAVSDGEGARFEITGVDGERVSAGSDGDR